MLNQAANKASQTGEAIALNLSRLLNEIEMSAAGFKGGAGSMFQSTSAELGNELRTILSALNEMAGNIQGSNAAFGSSDQDASAEIAKVNSTYLPGAGSVTSALRG